MPRKAPEKPGPGRPPGSKNKETLEREAVLAGIRQRIMRKADRLINAQFTKAEGCSFLFRQTVMTDENGRELLRTKAELVTSPDEIKAYLDGEYENEKSVFYYITTKEPDTQAIDSMLNRTFGRPGERDETDTPPATAEERPGLNFRPAVGARAKPRRHFEQASEDPN